LRKDRQKIEAKYAVDKALLGGAVVGSGTVYDDRCGIG